MPFQIRYIKSNEENNERMKMKKPGRDRAFMMDGLVSTGKFLSHHNIKNKFSDYKNFSKLFYSHFQHACGKAMTFFAVCPTFFFMHVVVENGNENGSADILFLKRLLCSLRQSCIAAFLFFVFAVMVFFLPYILLKQNAKLLLSFDVRKQGMNGQKNLFANHRQNTIFCLRL